MSSTDLVTILSTDWVESTAARSRLGEDRADELQRVHDEMLRDVITAHDGHVVKHSGDGILATFHSTTDALSAAVTIQQRFDAYSTSPGAISPMVLRVGLSAGDVLNRDGDIFGTPVVEAVRLEAAADSGQILCSELTRVLARGRGNFEFEFVGLLELKGLAEPVAACSVLWERHSSVSQNIALPPELSPDADALFVGRISELHLAKEYALSSAQAQTLWVLGEPGIGKTRLAAEVASSAYAGGALVLYGRCDEQVRTPFQPVIDSLRWFVSRQRDEDLPTLLGGDPEPLVRLVPELHARFPDLRRPEGATETEQYRLFESVRAFFGVIAAAHPVVFVVDDAHWADRPTLALLGHVARHAQPAHLTIIATARNTDPDISDPLTDLIDDLERTGRSRRLELRGLSTDEIATMVEATTVVSADSSLLAAQLAEETAGNPLFVGAVLAGVDAGGSLPTELPTDVRAAVRRRVGRLDPGARELLQVAGLVGLEFSLDVASDAAHLDESDGLIRVEQAVNAGLVEEIGIDRFRFTHALVRDALEAELSASRRARLHVAIARSIETRFAGRLDDHLHALSHHYAAAGTHDSLERAIDYAGRAARRSTQLLAFDAAAEDYSFALTLTEQIGDAPPSARFELVMAKGDAELLAGTHRAALRTFSTAADLARDEGDWPNFTGAVLAYEEANWRPGLPGHTSVALIREALEHEIDPPMRIRLTAGLARSLHHAGDPDAQRVADDALAAARDLNDRHILAYALNASVQTRAAFREGEPERVLDEAREVATLLSVEDDYLITHVVEQFAAIAALCVGDRAEFEHWYERVRSYAMLRFYRYVALSDQQIITFVDGNLDEAEALANRCLEFGVGLGEDVSGPHGVQMFLIRREQDRLGEVGPMVQMLLRANPITAMWRPGLALLLAELGMQDEGEQVLQELTANGARALPRDTLFPGALCLLAEAAFILGVSEAAPTLETELQPWRNGGVPLGHTVSFIGATSRYLAMLAWLDNRLDDADERFAEALEFNRRLRSPVWTARTLANWAGLRRVRGDEAGANALEAEATALAERHGLAAVGRLIFEQGVRKNLAE